MFVHEIDLFKRQILGLERQVRKKVSKEKAWEKACPYLGNAEEGEENAAETGGTPDEEYFDTQVGITSTGIDQVWCYALLVGQ